MSRGREGVRASAAVLVHGHTETPGSRSIHTFAQSCVGPEGQGCRAGRQSFWGHSLGSDLNSGCVLRPRPSPLGAVSAHVNWARLGGSSLNDFILGGA